MLFYTFIFSHCWTYEIFNHIARFWSLILHVARLRMLHVLEFNTLTQAAVFIHWILLLSHHFLYYSTCTILSFKKCNFIYFNDKQNRYNNGVTWPVIEHKTIDECNILIAHVKLYLPTSMINISWVYCLQTLTRNSWIHYTDCIQTLTRNSWIHYTGYWIVK